LAAGAGLAYLIQVLKPVFWSVRTLAEHTGATVLGAVSPAFPQALLRRKRWDVSFFSLLAGSFVALAVVVLGFSLLGQHLALPHDLGSLL
jgi:protein tyrosine kinase modulator